MTSSLYTIGHSNHSTETFISMLQLYGVTALCDVRSHPYSRYTPQFSRDTLKKELSKAGVAYVFLGKELGARSPNPSCYRQGKVQYDLLAREPLFINGIQRVKKGMERFCLALMCAEKDPLDCHRALLVGKTLHEMGVAVSHIKSDKSIESQKEMENRLLKLCKIPNGDMFRGRDECLEEAYSIQSERVAYQDDSMDIPEERIAA